MGNDSNSIPPTPSYGGAALQSLWPSIYTIATNTGVPPTLYYSLLSTEGLYQDGAWQSNASSGAAGPAQVLPSTANSLGLSDAANPDSPNFISSNLQAGAMVLNRDLQNSNGDVAAALYAYKGAVSDEGKASVAPAVAKAMEQAGMAGQVPTPSSTDSDTAPVTSLFNPLPNYGNNVDLASLVAPIVIIEGLSPTPWYADPNLLTGNPRLRQQVQPVSFKVMLHDNKDFLLSSKGNSGDPIQVQLNASMKSMSWSMKHIYHQQRTRTAQHITLWGMQADVIEGQCTTGVFMNQFGLTDYYSTRKVDDKLKDLVTSGYMFTNGNTSTSPTIDLGLGQKTNLSALMSVFNNAATPVTVNGPGGQSVTTVPGGGGNTNGFINTGNAGFQSTMNTLAKGNPNFTQTDAFRVAAQDAFMEFLALFKMNGSVWFWNNLYNDSNGNTRDWTGIQAWSPVLGMSSSQKNARNNDVLTRGGVLMSYRNFVYQGYFKTLQWTIDAHNPFKWDFSFTFQVERTIGQQFIPDR